MTEREERVLSIVCVYNDRDVLDRCLVASLNEQSCKDYETVFVDNTGNRFKTMEDAFGYALTQVKGELVAFSHQDVVFLSPGALQSIVDQVGAIPDLGVAGVAGAPYSKKKPLTVSNLLQGKNRERAAIYGCDAFYPCQTVDECFFVVPKQVLDEYPFNGLMNWHLYAVDYCLKAGENGKTVGVVPTGDILHLSPGVSLNRSYLTAIKKVFAAHPGTKVVYTTMGAWKRGLRLYGSFYIKLLKMRIKNH